MRRPTTVLLFALALAFAGWGCSKKTAIVAPVAVDPAPAPSSPVGVVRLLEWCWMHRDFEKYTEIFTDDFRFVFAPGDSAGNAYRAAPFTREDELHCATGLFVGSPGHPAASDITLDLDRTLITLPDDRPGKNEKWHKSIRTHVDLKVTIDNGSGLSVNEVHGYAQFYLVRGDSAAIPADLVARGFTPDSTRWWFERWEDQTLPAGSSPGSSTHALQTRSWGALKTLFR
jgi:hypothetical protein